MKRSISKHPLSPLTRRTIYAVIAVALVMTVGTVGMKSLTGWSWIDSFYFMSMVATAQGPPSSPPTFWSKIFASIMAFVSIGTLITAVGTIFGPFLGYVFHKGVMFAEKELDARESKEKGYA
ncbi:MAG: hypothetical protein M1587_10235 [Thaumarchaeota archaeon]|nr:hypothetical protein [Nitrososphaerota archaeon]